jgi:hypothetical protein
MGLFATVFLSAAIGVGLVYFIGKKVNIPHPVDGIVAIVILSGALWAVSGALNQQIPPPPSSAADDECVASLVQFPGVPCVTVAQFREQACLRNPQTCAENNVNRIFELIPLPYLIIAFIVGIGSAEVIDQELSKQAT